MSDARDLHIPLTEDHRLRAMELCDLIASTAVSAREAIWRGSMPLGLHHVGEARLALVALIPLARRLSEATLGKSREAA